MFGPTAYENEMSELAKSFLMIDLITPFTTLFIFMAAVGLFIAAIYGKKVYDSLKETENKNNPNTQLGDHRYNRCCYDDLLFHPKLA